MRYLAANSYEAEPAYEQLMINHKHSIENLPIKLAPEHQELLDANCIYWFGRDKNFRPISVMDLRKLMDMDI